MRKLLTSSLSIIMLASLILSLNTARATSLEISLSPAAFLPYISKEGAATPTAPVPPPPTPTRPPAPLLTPTPAATLPPAPTARPLISIVIVELNGHSDPEYVDIYNRGWAAQDMTGWYIVSVIGEETFYFPDGYVLSSSSLAQIESGQAAVDKPPLQLLWAGGTIWNNSGDKAVLYDSSDQAVSSACYGIGCAQNSIVSAIGNR